MHTYREDIWFTLLQKAGLRFMGSHECPRLYLSLIKRPQLSHWGSFQRQNDVCYWSHGLCSTGGLEHSMIFMSPSSDPKGLFITHSLGWDIFISVQITSQDLDSLSALSTCLPALMLRCSHQGLPPQSLRMQEDARSIVIERADEGLPRKNIFCVHWVYGCVWLAEESQVF